MSWRAKHRRTGAHRVPRTVGNVLRIQSRAIVNRAVARLPEGDRQTPYLGYSFTYPSRSHIGRAVSKGFVWDSPLRRIVQRLPPNATVCDIGANIGASLLTMCRERADVQFVCFEASSRYMPYLLQNVHGNGLADRVEAYRALIGPEGTRWTLSSDVTTGSVARRNRLRTRLLHREEMHSTGLDTWLASRPSPSLIKTDTDGFELQVLSSATSLLRRAHPSLFIEFCPSLLREVGDSPEKLLAFLLDAGYTTADLYSPAGEPLARDVPLIEVSASPYAYIDIAITGQVGSR